MAAAAAPAAARPPHALAMPAGIDKKPAGAARGFALPPTPPLSDDEHDDPRVGPARLDAAADRPRAPPTRVFERTLGDTELSYYLPSRADGVNDMYLHLGFRAPAALLAPARVRAAWAYLRLVHPPLAAHVRPAPAGTGAYAETRFAYAAPRSAAAALAQAGAALEFRPQGRDALVDAYLNGPRTLGDERLAYLIVGCGGGGAAEPLLTPASTPGPTQTRDEAFPPFPPSPSAAPASDPPEEDVREYDLLICATHFLGDGMALHRFANELFLLLAGRDAEGREKPTAEIEEMLRREWEARWGGGHRESAEAKQAQGAKVLPCAIEDALPQVDGRFRRAVGKVDFQSSQQNIIGGHAFPRKKHAVRRTVVQTVPLDAKKTKAVLKKCKENGVSIANAFFALSALAWGRVKELEKEGAQGRELPIMMYTALNLRPYLLASATADSSYWFTAIGYLNIVLPAFLPSSSAPARVHQTFWHRARAAKRQIAHAAKHPLLVSRTHEMARTRGARARAWAREDDEKDARARGAPLPAAEAAPADDAAAPPPWARARAPSTALVGLSMLGNLDGTYAHGAYPALALHTLTTGSRQRAGAALLFGYTFCGRLWLSLGHDAHGFADGAVERWWAALLRGVDEFLVG
ncbi:hypothetical protein DFH11DRAFT_1730086 [Phellopilus nigrolimitatus]|nr:hypothetical protein DFH11DRAFT_1730086 [Phellopilus nigrolimitatus]